MAWHKLAIFGAILTAACLASAARADFDPEAWRLSCDIKVPEGAAGANARFVVNNDMWDNAAGTDLRDLRIIRGETDDVGYVVYAPQEEPSTFVEHPARVFNIATRNTEASELTLDLGDNPPVTSRITIQTPAAEFGCAVTVEGSDDNRNWKTLRGRGDLRLWRRDPAAVHHRPDSRCPDAIPARGGLGAAQRQAHRTLWRHGVPGDPRR